MWATVFGFILPRWLFFSLHSHTHSWVHTHTHTHRVTMCWGCLSKQSLNASIRKKRKIHGLEGHRCLLVAATASSCFCRSFTFIYKASQLIHVTRTCQAEELCDMHRTEGLNVSVLDNLHDKRNKSSAFRHGDNLIWQNARCSTDMMYNMERTDFSSLSFCYLWINRVFIWFGDIKPTLLPRDGYHYVFFGLELSNKDSTLKINHNILVTHPRAADVLPSNGSCSSPWG